MKTNKKDTKLTHTINYSKRRKRREYDKNNEKVSTPKIIKLIHLFYYYINLKYISMILFLSFFLFLKCEDCFFFDFYLLS